MFFDDEPLALRKPAQLRALPPIPATGWAPRASPPPIERASVIGFDVETYDPDLTASGPGWARGRGHIVGVSLAAKGRTGGIGSWYFPLRHMVDPESNLDPARFLPWLKQILESDTPKIGANILYDCGWLSEEGVSVGGELHDVQFAEALIDERARVALEVLGQKYLGEGKTTNILYDWIREAYRPSEKEIRSNIYRSPPSLVGPYAEADASLPIRIAPHQFAQLDKEQLYNVYRMECDLIPLLVAMRREGVTVDVAKAEQMIVELEAETRDLYAKVKHEYGCALESTSTANLEKLLDHIGLEYPRGEPTRTKPKGNGKFEKEWLRGLEHPIGGLIIDIREREKICGTFLQSYIMEKNVNGKLYPQFHPLKGDENGTIVGRLSSSDPNLQNIPSRTDLGKRVRKAFVPDKGHFGWQKNDYSQIHYRILAHYAVDGNIGSEDFSRILDFWSNGGDWMGGDGSSNALRSRYRNDPATDYHMDVYRNVAPLLGWSLTDEKEIKVKRRPIKNVNFGLLYGQTEKSLAYKAGFSGGAAKSFFKSYHEGAPYVRATMAAIGLEVQTFGFVRTVLGRKVRFNLWEPVGFDKRAQPLPYEAAIRAYGSDIRRAYEYRGVNYKFQGSEPDIMKTGLVKLWRSGVFAHTGVPRLTVHDEIDFSVRDDTELTREAFKFIQETMQTALPLSIPVKVDVSRGPSWGEAD